ncbi:serine hydrolase domain-containing protein [Novosphingobium mangrovi (ex Hu et al. 2023)]|uniref:Beta-lactamase family protein n=1 Tax=Novosphingobium mangrovi (ex Hu et al. 2023) TaxID=2930094 RepID=A0ABT0AB92_9SPHN|nr:serine hydrolase domain-containing protein [Novosphingobium mangrovi (ex Hu et al. 2023)]MCJ1960456.1 beta-lactamase family protein [Novosphingobium mangrovi (ex Hu et al. 2023)]
MTALRSSRSRIAALAHVTCGALALLGAGGAAAEPQGEAAIRAVLSGGAEAERRAQPGCVFGAFENGRMVRLVAQGEADLSAHRPLDADTLFYGASLSKQFTALAAATLVEQGKLSLDDDVRQYLPELPAYARPVSVGMLMHHTSGIRDFLALLRLAGMEDVGEASRAQALDLLFRQQDTAFMPGSAYSYSNGGYLLLAEIVARVSGQSFADYAREAIFRPAGMPNAYFLDNANPVAGTFAHGYLPEGDHFVARDTFPRFSGSGGLMLSLADLAAWEREVAQGGSVWTPAVAEILLTPGRLADGSVLDDGKGLAYGGGLHIGRKGGERIVTHGGSAQAFKHAYLRLPDRGQSFALLCNRGDWKASATLEKALDAAGVRRPGMPEMPASGTYHSKELNADYTLAREGEGLAVTIASPLVESPRGLHFAPQDDGAFHAGPMRLVPTRDPARLTLSRGRSGELVLLRGDERKTR